MMSQVSTGPSSGVLDSSQLANAIAESVATGLEEIDALRAQVNEAAIALGAATDRLADSGSEEENAFALVLSEAAAALEQRITASRDVVETFNIAFFGRTGTGKSTLMSALGGLDGDRVSRGPSDWTTEIEAIAWHGCRLYDTPGTGGWGRTRSRSDLEHEARRAVELADVVILCFDDQGQQQAEFVLVAEWVRAYGKPAIAVFNNRNDRWLHPAKVADPDNRRSYSESVRQHVDNINGELTSIGLRGVPVVAMNSHRALAARAATALLGARPRRSVQGALDKFGADYLDTWSNLRVLEGLIVNCLVVGGTDLRLAALREGTRTALLEWSAAMRSFAEVAQDRAEVSERAVGQMLEVLGYPDQATRAAHLTGAAEPDILTVLEERRGAPFDAPVTGRLAAHARHLLRSHLGVERKKSLRRAEDVVIDALSRRRSSSRRSSSERFSTRTRWLRPWLR